MNKTLGWIVGVIVVVLLIIFLGKDKGAEKVANNTNTSETGSEEEMMGGPMSMSELAKGEPSACTFSDTSESAKTSGTVYVGGGKMRGDFSITSEGKTTPSHMIMMGGDVYVWMDGMAQGYKLSANQASEAGAERGFDPEKKVDFDCDDWTVDEGKFALPSGVSFKTMAELMMQGVMGGQ